MSDQCAALCFRSQLQKDSFARIYHILDCLNGISRRPVSFLDVPVVERACQELQDTCNQLMSSWNNFCIVPLIYLIEPVFRSFRVLIAIPNTRITVSCSQFLASCMSRHVKLSSTIAAERIFSSIFDFSYLKILADNMQKMFKRNAADFTHGMSFAALNSIVCLLSDVLENGASGLNMGSDLILSLFELYNVMMSNLNVEDPGHSCLIMKCSSIFPTAFKLRSKADIVVLSFKKRPDCCEESIRGSQSRDVRIQVWAALGSETFPLLHSIFTECFFCQKSILNHSQQTETATLLLAEICRKRQILCVSKLCERSNAAIQCVRLVIEALNRWRFQLVTGCALSKIDELKSFWFASESSFIIFLLIYCFDTCELIRNQAMSTLNVIATFCPSLFSQTENMLLISEALSTIIEFCKCPRLLSDLHRLRVLCSQNYHLLSQTRSLSSSRVRSPPNMFLNQFDVHLHLLHIIILINVAALLRH
jgi:hypothetical protein